MSKDENDLSEYTVVINGIEHTMLLDEATAESYGEAATKGGAKKAAPSNKAKAPANKAKD